MAAVKLRINTRGISIQGDKNVLATWHRLTLDYFMYEDFIIEQQRDINSGKVFHARKVRPITFHVTLHHRLLIKSHKHHKTALSQ